MLIKNIDQSLVNGSLGKVIEIDETSGFPIVQFVNDGYVLV